MKLQHCYEAMVRVVEKRSNRLFEAGYSQSKIDELMKTYITGWIATICKDYAYFPAIACYRNKALNLLNRFN